METLNREVGQSTVYKAASWVQATSAHPKVSNPLSITLQVLFSANHSSSHSPTHFLYLEVPRRLLNPGLPQTLGTAAWQMKWVTSPFEALVAVTVMKSKAGVPGGRTKDRISCSPSRSNTLRFGMGARGGREKQLTVWAEDNEFIQ